MDDGQLAVMAHGLINSAATISGSIAAARELFGTEHENQVDPLLDVAERQATFIANCLRDILLDVPEHVRRALDLGPEAS